MADIRNEKIENIIDVYEIGKNQLFKVSIYNILEDDEKKYDVCLNFGSEAEKIFYNEIIKEVTKNLKIFNFDNIVPLENLIEIYKQASLRILNSDFKFNNKIKNKIAYLASIQKLNLKKIFPFLIDDYIEEIFLDSFKGYIYLNHQTYGRCRTEVKFSQNELERLKTFIRLYSGLRLDYSNPSVKHVIKNKYFYCRFAIDVDPINPNNFAMDIRKLNRNVLTIQDLIKNNTLDSLMAGFLYYCILNRNNITVTGETDTGKTTLINALDLLTPKGFRKIYVENIIESLNQSSFYKHQLKFKVDPLDYDLNEKFTKSSLIKTLLHRTPDLIYLGEILTREEAEALFHCLAAGLRGFQTIHCNDIDSLINRFLYHFKIDPSCLKDLNLIVLMKKDHTKRRVISINEINPILSKKYKYYRTIFNFNSKLEKWEILIPLFETNAINQIKLYKDINLEDFNLTIQIYTEIFDFISKLKKLDNFELVAFFHKVSYYSMRSITLLKDFWETWKNKWSLNL
jgi:flagellar protein FlaI